MPKITPRPSITAATVKAALKRSEAGEHVEIKDGSCPELTLRGRGGELRWSIRGRLHGKYRRWISARHRR